MVNSVGKKLQQSRLSKQLSIEEAARVTRIRPDKLLDLEEDNYSNFPSMSYAKGFLLLYARFLGVDVREFAESIHAPNPVSSDDYEYLNAAAESPPPPPSRRPYYFAPRREHTILPVIVFAFLIGAIVLAIYLVVNFQRLGGNLDDIADKKALASPAAASPPISTMPEAPVAAEPAPAASAVPVGRPVPTAPAPVLRSAPPAIAAATPVAAPATPVTAPAAPVTVAAPVAPAAPAAAEVSPSPLPPAATFDPSREVRRAEPVSTPPDHASASPTPALPPVGSPPAGDVTLVAPVGAPDSTTDAIKHVSILPVRKTMVTIRKDVADSAPIFEDWLYPGAGPLKVSGHKFWIEVQDPGAVQITQDGQPIGAGQSDVQIE